MKNLWLTLSADSSLWCRYKRSPYTSRGLGGVLTDVDTDIDIDADVDADIDTNINSDADVNNIDINIDVDVYVLSLTGELTTLLAAVHR